MSNLFKIPEGPPPGGYVAISSACRSRSDMPHIFFRAGYWRVTPWNRLRQSLSAWHRANIFVSRLNRDILYGERA